MMNRSSRAGLSMVGVLAAASVAWAAVPGTVATFDTDEDGFVGSTIATVQIYAASGGNPDGHVQIRKDLTPGFDIGTQNSVWPEFLGDYAAAGVTGGGFDLNVFNTTLDSAQLRFRRNVAENGWYFDFGAVAPNNNLWASYDVAFDPTWSDANALANGWTQEPLSPSFADLMASVGWLEVRLINEASLIAGVDNVRIVPEPTTLGLVLAGCAALRRRR
ncbi:MAG: PEP-CTERM sorting domain-containing protein [Phycisphaerae bacterium]|nr:PEP-CTERM sorting domain-containing protein [Phycisphaerae bacterium]